MLPDLLSWQPPDSDRHGSTYVPEWDYERLNGQMRRVYDTIVSGCWLTLKEISGVTGDPESSISARLRDLRKPEFGGFIIDRRRRGDPGQGLHEYKFNRPGN